MSTVLNIAVEDILPEVPAILAQQGMPPEADTGDEISAVVEAARAELENLLAPAGVLAEVTRAEFEGIYPGQGFNDPYTPLDLIFPRAERLVLFVVTCGQPVCERIRDLFNANEYPLGAALDAAASLAADQAAQVAQDIFAATLDGEAGVLRYSPGYCGWHVSGQKALFGLLGAEAAGVALTDSFLMQPLKSVSGVIIAGPPDIHRFANDFPFCTTCTGMECRDRITSVLALPGNEI
jgi:hypothetical protein